MRNALCLALLVAALMTGFRVSAAREVQNETLKFVPLFNGKDLAGWVSVNVAPGTFTVKDGVIHSTGLPTGVMRTDRQYENFVIELEWLHERPGGNAGLFLWGEPLTAPGTPFAKGIEVQILDDAYVTGAAREQGIYTGHGDIFAIHGATMKPDRPHPQGWERCLPSEHRAKPAGQWNHYRVEARDGRITLAVNGKVVSGGSACRPRKGYLCLESEGAPAQFKNIRIAELPSTNPKPDEVASLDQGFKSIYTGVDLSGWVGGAGPNTTWHPRDWTLLYDGKGNGDAAELSSEKAYGDVTLVVDWHVPPTPPAKPGDNPGPAAFEAEIALRGDHAVFPLATGGAKPGEWYRTVATLKGNHLTVTVNGKPAITDKPLGDSLPTTGVITLRAGSHPIEFANLFVREAATR